jgi:hypothetical protein
VAETGETESETVETRQTTTRAEFLDKLRSSWDAWQALLSRAGEARMTQPGVQGKWSLKDIVAHITWGEREMVGVLRTHALDGSDLWNVPQQGRNDAVYHENRERALVDVLTESARVHAELLAFIEALGDDADLNDAGHYAQMPPEWQPWQVFAGNTFDHYAEHAPDVRAWLDAQDQSAG